MKERNNVRRETIQTKTNFNLIPEDILDILVESQNRILEILEGKNESSLNGFITEKKAIELINKKATWFWQMRKTGQLPFKKIGQTIYYSPEDLNSLLQS